ncbi:MAG: folylpolyglutamate synthase/dihydrofolate synthase family protein [Saprospiraceae bacterium]
MKSRYQQTLDYLFAQLPMFHRIGPAAFKKDLGNTLAFCAHLGDPHLKFPSVHIAGTNGKGSVAHMLAAIFTARGKKTGLYTSPHYRDFRERIKIDGQFIPKKTVIDFVEKHRSFSEELKPSFFEWTVALAFDYFAHEKVDIAIIETGLGGRLDSTNVITPLLSIITNIGYDHMELLGDTLPLIAGEKAGIIKQNVPVVIGEMHPETRSVFGQKAKAMNAPIFFADQYYQVELLEKMEEFSFYKISKAGKTIFEKLALQHTADYQQKNLPAVLQAMEILDSHPPYPPLSPHSPPDLQTGLKDLVKYAGFIGRWSFISRQPRILCDSAHNEDGIRQAMQGLEKLTYDKLHFVLGLVSDKSPDKVLALLPPSATYYFAKANIPRGLDAGKLKEKAASFGLNGKAYSSVRKALAAAKRKARPGDLIYVGGSIFVVAEVI